MEYVSWQQELATWARAHGRNVALFAAVSSTNEVAQKVLTAEPAELRPSWLLALHQWAGRGQGRRRWRSPFGAGLYASYLYRLPASSLVTAPMAVGVALCTALSALGFRCRLKWPNDILLDGRKLGGILMHSRPLGDATAALVVGFGLNLSHQRSQLPRPDATSLALAAPGSEPRLTDLTRSVCEAVERGLAAARPGGRIVNEYRAWSAHLPGDRLVVETAAGRCEGSLVGFADSGHLVLATPGGERRIASGDLASHG